MLPSLLKLKNAQVLNENEQKKILGGAPPGTPTKCCDPEMTCCTTNPEYDGTNCRFIPGPPCV